MLHIKLPRFDGELTGEIEVNYRLYSLQEDVKQSVVGILFVFIPVVLFVYNDYLIFGQSITFYSLSALRGVFLIYGAALLAYFRHVNDPKKYDSFLFIWGLIGIALATAINYTRPASYMGHAIIDVGIILVIYLGIPYRLNFRFILATIFTAGCLIQLWIDKYYLSLPYLLTTLFTLLLVNGGGLLLSHRLYSYRRRQYVALMAEEKSMEELARLASTDSLTGVLNRRAFLEEIEKELRRFKRYGQSFSFLYVDIDDFKSINDMYGHLNGDLVLRKLAEVVGDQIRESDIFGRLGGDEFGMVLVATSVHKAAEIAGRISATCSRVRISLDSGAEIKFTVSIGVSESAKTDENVDQIIGRGDAAMYQGKSATHN